MLLLWSYLWMSTLWSEYELYYPFCRERFYKIRGCWWCLMTRSEISRGKFLPGKRGQEVCLSATAIIFHFIEHLIFHFVYSKHTDTEAAKNYKFFRDFSGFLMRILYCNLPGVFIWPRSTLNFACCQSDMWSLSLEQW